MQIALNVFSSEKKLSHIIPSFVKTNKYLSVFAHLDISKGLDELNVSLKKCITFILQIGKIQLKTLNEKLFQAKCNGLISME